MRTPKITAKRALGLTLAGALAVAGTVAVANISQAATVQTLKLSTTTGGPGAGAVITVTGKDFQNAAGASKVGNVFFSTSACAATAPGGSLDASVVNVASTTKLTITAPALAATNAMKGTKYFLCVDSTGDSAVLGSGTYTVYPAPVINATSWLSTNSGPTSGGTSITITGENFTTKTSATVGGKALTGTKVVIGSGTTTGGTSGDDTLTGTVPVGTAGTADIVVTSEGGKDATKTASFTYVSAASVSPTGSVGTAGLVITVTGSGFSSKTFANAPAAATTSEVALTTAGSTIGTGASTLPLTGAGTVAPKYCTSVQVVSDTELNCKLPNLTAALGAYNVQVVDTTSATAATGASAPSKSSTYTVSAF